MAENIMDRKIRIEMDVYEAGVVSGILYLAAGSFKEDQDPALRMGPALRVFEKIRAAVNELQEKNA